MQRFRYGIGAKFVGQFTKDPTPSIISKIERKLNRDSLCSIVRLGGDNFLPDIIKKYMCTEEFWEIHATNNPNRHIESLSQEVEGLDNVNKVISRDVKFYIPDGLMIKVDRMCMAHELETLSPFQDKKVSMIVNKMPGSFKIHLAESGEITRKYILQKICRNRLPNRILTKKNQGFSIPLEKWLKQDNGEYIKEILWDNKTYKRGYFKKDALNNFVNTFINNKGDWYYPNSSAMVLLLMIELWHRKYLD